jgi:hypothetical protein
MNVFKVRVWPADDANVRDFPAIEIEGRVWTIVAWHPSPDGKLRTPALAIPQEKLRLIPYTRPEHPGVRFAANERPPKAALSPPIAQTLIDRYEMAELNHIQLPPE